MTEPVWLDPEATTPYDFYQYWVNADDADVERLLRLYTFLPESRIAELTAAGYSGVTEASSVKALAGEDIGAQFGALGAVFTD